MLLRACLAVVTLAHSAARCSPLRCYRGLFDCFPGCQPITNITENCSFVTAYDDNTNPFIRWNCHRTSDTCTAATYGPPNCSAGLDYSQAVVECLPQEGFCYSQYRRPQNSRYGKMAVWGFEAVYVRGCAETCNASNASASTGIGTLCCSTDLCNHHSKVGIRRSVSIICLVLLLALS